MGLFEPIWMTNDYKKEKKAVNAVAFWIYNQDTLYKIATTAPLMSVRRKAVSKIKDQERLYQIALTKLDEEGRDAIFWIKDPSLLEKLAFELEDYYSQDVLMRHIRSIDEALLRKVELRKEQEWPEKEKEYVRIVVEAKDIRSAEYALKRLKSQSAFAQVALNAVNEDIRSITIEYHLTDQAALQMVARDEKNEGIRANAIVKLEDPDLLKEYADEIAGFRGYIQDALKVVGRLRDAMALLVIASGTCYDKVRAQCLEKLNKPGHCFYDRLDADRLTRIIMTCDDNEVCAAAVKGLEILNVKPYSEAVSEKILQAKLVRAAAEGHTEVLAANAEASFTALAGEFQKYIDDFTKERKYISFDDHFKSIDLEKMKYYALIAAGLRFLHDEAGMAPQVETRFPEKSYTCRYYWWESGDNGSRIECDGWETIVVWN